MTQAELLILLLEHLPDFYEAGRAGGPSDNHGSRLLLFDPELDLANTNVESPFIELDRCLALMKNQGKQQAVRYKRLGGPNDGTQCSCSLATARWHLLAWYIPDRYEQPRSYHRKRHGRNETIRPKPQPVRHKDAREDRAHAGLEWLTAHFDWSKATPGLNHLRKEQKIQGLTYVTGKAA